MSFWYTLLLLQGTKAAREHRRAWCWVRRAHGWEDPEPSPKWIQAPALSLPSPLPACSPRAPRMYNGRRGLNELSAATAALPTSGRRCFGLVKAPKQAQVTPQAQQLTRNKAKRTFSPPFDASAIAKLREKSPAHRAEQQRSHLRLCCSRGGAGIMLGAEGPE